MNYYEFDSKQMDKQFLDFNPVLCKVAILKTEWEANALNSGDAIVVMLTNRKKYKGIVNKMHLLENMDHIIGHIEIVRPK